jgi:hypothetical protein
VIGKVGVEEVVKAGGAVGKLVVSVTNGWVVECTRCGPGTE